MSLPSQKFNQPTNSSPRNSQTDRSFESMLREVKAQKTVQSSVETLLIGIGTLQKEGRLDDENLDRILNKYTKAAGEAVISGTPAQVTHDTTGAADEVTIGHLGYEYDPSVTPGAQGSEVNSIPRDISEVEDDTVKDKDQSSTTKSPVVA